MEVQEERNGIATRLGFCWSIKADTSHSESECDGNRNPNLVEHLQWLIFI